MARTSICNVRIENEFLAEHIDVLSRAYGYPTQVSATVKGESVLVPNPESKSDFVQRTIRERVSQDYKTQYKLENPVTVTYKGD